MTAGTVPNVSGTATAFKPTIRVMICDDSLVIRNALARLLESDPTIRIVARVANGAAALSELHAARPDVLVLDIEMPVMDGMAALPRLLKADPTLRVIMASTLTTRGADVTMRALRLGAADYIPKPNASEIADTTFRSELLAKVRGQGRLRQRQLAAPQRTEPRQLTTAHAPLALRPAGRVRAALLAIGSSTGGPQALFSVVQGLGRDIPVPVLLTQHMPSSFIPMLAEHLSRLGAMPCLPAQDGESLSAGRIYLAPGDRHLCVEQNAGSLRARINDGPPENFCRPAVDPMLRSAASATGGRVLIAMLTGMGHDGLAGTRAAIAAGATAIAQDEATSVVWGMPGAIAQDGLCHAILPLPRIAPKIRDLLDLPPL